jgi:hypothetical protein
MSDIYGHLFGMPFARYDLDTQSWRTSLDTSLLDLPMSSLTLPRSGGMRSGQLFERPMLEPATAENDYSSLPTPTAQAAKHLLDDRGVGTLDDFNLWSVAGRLTPLLPTPRAQNGETRNMHIYARPLDQPQNLENALALLPTPVADHSRGLQQNGTDYQSLPDAVIALTGDSTPKPSTDGKTPLDDQPLTQLSWADTTNPD